MATVVGLDESLTGFGAARFARNRAVQVATIRSEAWADVYGWGRAARRHRIAEQLRPWLAAPAGDVIAIVEGRIPPAKGRGGRVGWESALDRAELSGTVEDMLYEARIPIARVPVPTLKKYATGRGDADKDMMTAAARHVLGTGLLIGNDNEADAFWLMVMGVHHYGLVPDTHRLWTLVNSRSMDRVEWPQWTPRMEVGG